jgi:hypothetical protein
MVVYLMKFDTLSISNNLEMKRGWIVEKKNLNKK